MSSLPDDQRLAQALLARGLVDATWLQHARVALQQEPGLTLLGLIRRHQALPESSLAEVLAALASDSGRTPGSRPPVLPVESVTPQPPPPSGARPGSASEPRPGERHSTVAGSRPAALGSAAELQPGQSLGHYVITRELGRGGMGVVFEASQPGLERKVAIKLLLGTEAGGARERFELEGRAMARLQHPHILRVLEVGEAPAPPGTPGALYLVSELAEGGSLADRLESGGPLELKEACELAQKVAEALAHAHERGIVHRDVKPDNILLSADGEPLLTDFGLAKALDAELAGDGPSLSRSGHMIGTPQYMPPEQLEGRGVIDGRADVYALGATLFELIAGRPPFDDDARDSLMVAILMRPPPSLARQVSGVPRELDLVLDRCLAKAPEDRYTGAAELAADLARLVAGEPVQATALSPLVRLRLWRRRNPVGAALAAILAIVLLLGPPAWLLDRQRRAVAEARELARLREQGAEREQRRFDEVRSLARTMLFEIHDEIRRLPGSTGARRLIVTKASNYLDRLAESASDDASLKAEMAEARLKVAEVLDGPDTGLGKTAEARRNLEEAVRLRQDLAAAEPGPAASAALLDAELQTMELSLRRDLAVDASSGLAALGERLARLPASAATAQLGARHAILVARHAARSGESEVAETALRRALNELRSVPRDTRVASLESELVIALARQLDRRGLSSEARAVLEQAIQAAESSSTGTPTGPSARESSGPSARESSGRLDAARLRLRARLRYERGRMIVGQGAVTRGLENLLDAERRYQLLTEADVANLPLALEGVAVRLSVVSALLQLGRGRDCGVRIREANEVLGRLTLLDRGNPELRRLQVRLAGEEALLYRRQALTARSWESMERYAGGLIEETVLTQEVLEPLVEVARGLRLVGFALGKGKLARERLETLGRRLDGSPANRKRDEDWRIARASLLISLSNEARERGGIKEACRLADQAVALCDPRDRVASDALRLRFADIMTSLATCYRADSRSAECRARLLEARRVVAPLLAREPEALEIAAAAAAIESALGSAAFDRGDGQAAHDHFARSLEIIKPQLETEEPAAPMLEQGSVLWSNLAAAQRNLKRTEEAHASDLVAEDLARRRHERNRREPAAATAYAHRILYRIQGERARKLGRPRDWIPKLREALELVSPQGDARPLQLTGSTRAQLAGELTTLHFRLGQEREGRAMLKTLDEAWRDQMTRFPGDAVDAINFGAALLSLTETLQARAVTGVGHRARLRDAVKRLEPCLQRAPDQVTLHLHSGWVALLLAARESEPAAFAAALDRARRWLKRTLELRPDLSTARTLLESARQLEARGPRAGG